MDDQTLNRRQILRGVAAASATGLLVGANSHPAAAADLPDMGASQAPPITDVKGKVAYYHRRLERYRSGYRARLP